MKFILLHATKRKGNTVVVNGLSDLAKGSESCTITVRAIGKLVNPIDGHKKKLSRFLTVW